MTLNYENLRSFLYQIMLVGGFLSYTADTSFISSAGYILSFLSLIALALTVGLPKCKEALYAFGMSYAAGLVTIIGLMMSPLDGSIGSVVQNLTYPLVNLLYLLIGFRMTSANPRNLAMCVLVLASVNTAIALAGAMGVISTLPMLGEIETGRYIFGTKIPSASGLNLNVNYYATTQATLMLLYGWLQSARKERLSKTDVIVLLLMFLSAQIGSSRGILGAQIVALVSLSLVSLFCGSQQSRFRTGFVGLIIVVVVGTLVLTNLEGVSAALRVERGLNARDTIWSSGIRLWIDKPLFGWGTNIGALLGQHGPDSLSGRSLHSGYLHTLVRGGGVLFVITYTTLFGCLFWGLGRSRNLWYKHRWPIAVIVFYLVSSIVRTYSVGGLGLLPMSLGLALSTCLFSKETLSREGSRNL